MSITNLFNSKFYLYSYEITSRDTMGGVYRSYVLKKSNVECYDTYLTGQEANVYGKNNVVADRRLFCLPLQVKSTDQIRIIDEDGDNWYSIQYIDDCDDLQDHYEIDLLWVKAPQEIYESSSSGSSMSSGSSYSSSSSSSSSSSLEYSSSSSSSSIDNYICLSGFVYNVNVNDNYYKFGVDPISGYFSYINGAGTYKVMSSSNHGYPDKYIILDVVANDVLYYKLSSTSNPTGTNVYIYNYGGYPDGTVVYGGCSSSSESSSSSVDYSSSSSSSSSIDSSSSSSLCCINPIVTSSNPLKTDNQHFSNWTINGMDATTTLGTCHFYVNVYAASGGYVTVNVDNYNAAFIDGSRLVSLGAGIVTLTDSGNLMGGSGSVYWDGTTFAYDDFAYDMNCP